MFSSKKSALKAAKHNSVVVPCHSTASSSNPFDSDNECDNPIQKTTKAAVLKPIVTAHSAASSWNPFDSDDEHDKKRQTTSLSTWASSDPKREFKTNPFDDDEVEELENYAVHMVEETTKSVNKCVKIAEGMREEGSKTLMALHHQGEQITRAHGISVDIDHELSRGEKLLGKLGGIFSKKWKPKRTRAIAGPVITKDDGQRKGNRLKLKVKFGLGRKDRSNSRAPPSSELASSMQKVEAEKAKQDDALSDLSNILVDLKDMALDMSSEIDRQNKALEPFHDDIDELNYRVKQVNEQGRRLLGK